MNLTQQGALTSRQYTIEEKSLKILSKGIFKNQEREIPYEQIVMEERFSKNQVDSSLVSSTVLVSILLIALLFSQFRIYDMMDLLVSIGGLSVIIIVGVRFLRSNEIPQLIIPAGKFGYIEIATNKPDSKSVNEFSEALDVAIRQYLIAEYAIIDSGLSIENQLADFMWLRGRNIISQEKYLQLRSDAHKIG